MSKGGAGKVYFVLYLAVILELLIIIVERDEAEEHLIKKQKESMRIVESILSQLQVGAGTEGINTRPQDQITIPPPGVNVKEMMGGVEIKPERKYLVEVGVTDVSTSMKMTEGEEPEEYRVRMERFLRLANVTNLKYEILFANETSESVPMDTSMWKFQAQTELKLDYPAMEKKMDGVFGQHGGDPQGLIKALDNLFKDAVYPPVTSTPFKPGRVDEPEFYYSAEETNKLGLENSRKKRSFVVNFEPKEAGWYKLRFSSQANKILGVSIKEGQDFEIDPDEKVNIGTVQLKVEDLLKVRKELEKTTEGLPAPELAKSDLDAFEGQIQTLIEKADEAPEKARITLYGAIVKLTTPGIKAENAFDRNKGTMEFNIRVLKPKPQITDPKIADLKGTIRVFDKLEKIVIPVTVTPANGTTEFLKNPANATTVATGQVASSSDASGKWIAKNVIIPVRGVLAPRAEPYVFELQQRNQGKESEVARCSVYVYDSKIINDEEVLSFMEVGWGDALEFVAVPTSGNSIPPEEFIMQFNLGGGTQTPPLRKLNVKLSDNVIVPPGVESISVSIGWKDPISGDVVELYKGSAPVGLKKPSIITTDMVADPIMDQMSGEFVVKGIKINPPGINETERASVGTVEVEVLGASVRDLRTSESYRVVTVGKPRKVGTTYEQTLKLTGGRTPLTRGQVKGSVELRITATAAADGTVSRPRILSKTVSVSN
jgi:hypothetical protein